MGHADASMAAVYRERISDDRLRAVVDHVRAWLFPPKPAKKKSTNKVKAKSKHGAETKDRPTLRGG